MNCTEFESRLQQRLDQRLPLESDPFLQQHADRCDACRGQLETWRKIDSVVTPSSQSGTPETDKRRRTAALSALAATILLALVWQVARPSSDPRESQRLVSNDPKPVAVAQPNRPTSAGPAEQLYAKDPAGWWRGVQSQDWVAQTMPAVRSLREGVAPLRRSLIQAVTILTIGGGDQHS